MRTLRFCTLYLIEKSNYCDQKCPQRHSRRNSQKSLSCQKSLLIFSMKSIYFLSVFQNWNRAIWNCLYLGFVWMKIRKNVFSQTCLIWVIFVAAPEMRKTSNANSCHECNNLTHPLTDMRNFLVEIWMTWTVGFISGNSISGWFDIRVFELQNLRFIQFLYYFSANIHRRINGYQKF